MENIRPHVLLLDKNLYTDINTGSEGLFYITEPKKIRLFIEMSNQISN